MKIAVGSWLLLTTLVQCWLGARSNSPTFEQLYDSPPVDKAKLDICLGLKRSNENAYTACKRIMDNWVSCGFVAKLLKMAEEPMAVAARRVHTHVCGSPGVTFPPEKFTTPGEEFTTPASVTPPKVTLPAEGRPPRDLTCGQSPVLRRREPLMNVGGGGGGGLGRIVGGEDAKGCSTIPWQVQINANLMLCGGSVLSPNHVLTAAHCVDKVRNMPQRVVVRAADYDMGASEEKVVGVKTIVVHEGYVNETVLKNDLALLTLNESLEFSKCVTPVCLDPTFLPDGHYCVVAGWGHDKLFGEVADKLQMARVKAYRGGDCTRVFNPYTKDYVKDEASTICAGYIQGGIGTCHGDSGGPLVCWSEGRYVQAGLVSYSEGCAWSRAPTVYTSLSFFHAWITAKMAIQRP